MWNLYLFQGDCLLYDLFFWDHFFDNWFYYDRFLNDRFLYLYDLDRRGYFRSRLHLRHL